MSTQAGEGKRFNGADDPRRWKCEICKQHHVIPSFARQCEADHAAEALRWQNVGLADAHQEAAEPDR